MLDTVFNYARLRTRCFCCINECKEGLAPPLILLFFILVENELNIKYYILV